MSISFDKRGICHGDSYWCGGYYTCPRPITDRNPVSGWCCYTDRDGQLESKDSQFRLRLEHANDHLEYTRLGSINGYYCDQWQDETYKPIIARLPNRRGFLAGWTMGKGMITRLDRYIHETAKDAAMFAHSLAKADAEVEREYQEREAEMEREREEAENERISELAMEVEA